MRSNKIGRVEEKYIRENIDILTLDEMAIDLKVTKSYICKWIKRNNLTKKYVLKNKSLTQRGNYNYKAWTKEELEYLKENYPNGNTRKIAFNLNRSYFAIMSKVKALGLYKEK